MKKTYLEDATILSVFDFQKGAQKSLGSVIFGIVYSDQTRRFSKGQRLITSLIQSQKSFEFKTKSGSFYVTNDEPEQFDISFAELVVMRHRLYSPVEIVELRQMLKLNDDRIIH